jgi:murein DD-endopeptidase MepM/ murein hydrolase activator NlpD
MPPPFQIEALRQAARELVQSTQQVLQRHPKRVTAGIGALLLGTGVTAFGVDTFSDNVLSRQPIREVLETVNLQPLTSGLEPSALAPTLEGAEEGLQPLVLYRNEQTRREDSLASLLQRLGVADSRAQQALQLAPEVKALLTGRAGKSVMVAVTPDQRLQELTAYWADSNDERAFKRLRVQRHGNGFDIKTDQGALSSSMRIASGTIQSSLFAAADAIRLPDDVTVQIAEMFSSDIDFRRDLRKGDRFSVVYEILEINGEPVRTGRVLSAEFVNAGKVLQAIWYQEPGRSKGGFYSFDGQSRQRAYLASPVEFSRVSSGYGMRFHPVHGEVRAHLGVDFVAPIGTPVRSVGDGIVEVAGWQGGYGNIIVVKHRNNQSTAYAHLSRIQVRQGERVEQGETIGLVGSTGISTGPHLHFEFRDNGTHRDPMLIAKEGETIPVSPAAMPAFLAHAQQMKRELAAASSVTTANGE